MSRHLFTETINGASINEIHDSAFSNLVRAYHKGGSVYVSEDDLDEIAWNATIAVYEKRDSYVKEDKNVCGLACTIAYNDLMKYLKKSRKKNESSVPMEHIDTERGQFNVADRETGRKFCLGSVGVGREFDTSFGAGMEIIENEVHKLSEIDRRIYELNLDGVPHTKIAEMLGITPGNARKKWHDIKKRLLRNKYIFSRAYELGLVG